jgi:hypothetical protein
MRALSIIFFLSVLPSFLLAQQARPPAIEWMREYEGEANAYASQVIVTSDGGFVVTGITSPPVQGPWAWNSLYLAKTDDQGHITWEKGIYESDRGSCFYGYSAIEAEDGGFLAAGNTDGCDYGPSLTYLVKTTAAGELSWYKVHDAMSTVAICEAGDGGIMALGATQNWPFDVSIMKLDAQGEILWQKTIEESESSWGHKIHRTRDGNFIIVAVTHEAEVQKALLIKIDGLGEVLWERNYDADGFPIDLGSVDETSDGGLILSGLAQGLLGTLSICLLKTDGAGEISWKRTFDRLAPGGAGAVRELPDGGFVAAGWIEHGLDWNAIILKVDSRGGLAWDLEVDGGFGTDWATSIALEPDGGIVVAGTFTVPNQPGDAFSGGRRHAFLLKLAPETPFTPGPFIRGDANDDGILDLSDVLRSLESLFLGGGDLACLDAADANDDGRIDIADPISLLDFLFISGAALPGPFPGPGQDPTPDDLGCLR